MRVAIDASNLRGGGGVTHLVELLRSADPHEHGFEHLCVWGGRSTLSKIEPRPWISIVHEPLLDRPLPYRVFWQAFKFRKLVTAARCDVLFVPGGSDATGFAPMVTMSRNMLPFEWHELRRYGFSLTTIKLALLRITQARTFRSAHGVIFLTDYARTAVVRVTGQLRGLVATVPHGVGTQFLHVPRAPRNSSEFTATNPCRVIYVSPILPYKHQWHVADAVARLHASGIHIALDLVGPAGPGMARLERTLQRLDPDGAFIRYRGPVPHDALHEIYAEADVGVFASSCENMPNILLESMAAGLPLACSRMGPMPEVLGEAGCYFDPERPDEIAAALRHLIESRELRTMMAARAHRRAQDFSWKRCARETFAFLATICESFEHASVAAASGR